MLVSSTHLEPRQIINMKEAGAHEKAMAFLSAADAKGEKVVLHCAGAQGRTGIILASWLVSNPLSMYTRWDTLWERFWPSSLLALGTYLPTSSSSAAHTNYDKFCLGIR